MQKNFLITSLFLFTISPLLSREVDIAVQLQIGDRVNETEIRVNSKNYTQLSMNGEKLGFAIRLVNEEEQEEEDDEKFETNPTYNGKPISMKFFSRRVRIGSGANLNGHRFEKELAIAILGVKKVS